MPNRTLLNALVIIGIIIAALVLLEMLGFFHPAK